MHASTTASAPVWAASDVPTVDPFGIDFTTAEELASYLDGVSLSHPRDLVEAFSDFDYYRDDDALHS